MKKLLYCMLLAVIVAFGVSPTMCVNAADNQYFDPHRETSEYSGQKSIVISKNADFSSWSIQDIYPSVEEISFEDGMEKLEKVIFNYFPNVKKINLPMTMTDVGDAFQPYEYGSDLKDYDYSLECLETITVDPENVTYVDFDGVLYTKDRSTLICYPSGNQADSYTMPQFVTTISYQAFGQNPYLKQIHLGTRCVMSISYDAYFLYGTLPNLESYTVAADNIDLCSEDGVLFSYDKTKLLAYPKNKVENYYKIPETVTELGQVCFQGAKIKQLEIPPQLIIRDDGLMDEFNGSEIEAIVVSPESTWYSTEDGVLYNKDKTELICWPYAKKVTKLKFPSTLKRFYFENYDTPNLSQVTELVIPKQCTDLYIYPEMHQLKSITVEKGNKTFTVRDGLLYQKNMLLLIPEKITKSTITIPAYCTEYDSMAMMKNVTSVKKIILEGSGAQFPYESFPNLERFELKKGNKKAAVINQVLYSADKKTMIWYPQAKKETSFTVPSAVTTFAYHAFYGQKYLKTITLPKKLKSARSYSQVDWFVGCKNLEKINVNSDNTALKAVNGILYTKNMKVLICYPQAKKEETYQMPDSVQQFVLSNPLKLTTLQLGAGFKEFINLYDNRTETYEKLSKLVNLTVSAKNPIVFIQDGVLYQKIEGDVHMILYPLQKKDVKFTIPSNVFYIWCYEAFINHPYLQELRTDSKFIRVYGRRPEPYYSY